MPRPTSSRQPAELQLLGALCHPNPTIADDAAAWLRQVKDWTFFLKLAEHHRIRPLILKGATRLAMPIPDEVQRALREQSIGNAREAFRYLAELQRLLAMLASAGIPATVLKGVPLSYAAYGDVGLREVGDIDLLIDPSDAMAADALLRQSGLVRKEPAAPLTPTRSAFYKKYFKDFTYEPSASASGFEIDLHWRLVRDAKMAQGLLPRSNSGEGRQSLTIGSLQIEVLMPERSLLYLAVHGATEGWARWKSLADIAALWTQFAEDERRGAWAAAEASGCVDFLQSALRLAEEWMGPLAAFGPPDEASLTKDNSADYIVDYAHRRIVEGRGLASPAGETTFAMKRHEARLYPSFASRRALAMRVLFRPRVWETVHLPDALFPFYALLSPAEWIYFRLKRLLSQGDPQREPGLTRWERARGRRLQEWLLLCEAGLWLIAARAVLKLVPMIRIIGWIRRPLENGTRIQPANLEQLRWSVTAFSRNAPIRLVCFPQALALYAMLRRRRIASEVLYGAARSADGKLTAHAWLRCGGRVWVGGEVAGDFTVLDVWRPAGETS